MVATPKTINNWFETTLSAAVIVTGAGNIFMNQLPTDDEGWLVLDPSSPTKREIIRFIQNPTSRAGGYVIVEKDEDRGVGGTTAQTHLQNAAVKMNNTAQHYQYLDKFIERIKQGLVEKAMNTGLALKIYPMTCLVDGQHISYGGTTHWGGADSQSVTNNATNYVEIDTSGVIQINQVGFTAGRKKLAVVVAASGNITSVTDYREFGSEMTLATIQTLIAAHANLHNNPHQVTLEQARSQNNVLSGIIAMGGFVIQNLGTPSAATDAVTKGYVDALFPPSGGVSTIGIFGDANSLTAAVKLRALSSRLTIARNAGNNSFDFDAVQQTANDYTTVEKNKLAGIEAGANLYVLPQATEGTLGGANKASDAEFNAGTENTKFVTAYQIKNLSSSGDLKTNFTTAEAVSTDDPAGVNVEGKIRKAFKALIGANSSTGVSGTTGGLSERFIWLTDTRFVVVFTDATTVKARAGTVADDGTITWAASTLTFPTSTVASQHCDADRASDTELIVSYRSTSSNAIRVAHVTINVSTLALTIDSTADTTLTLGSNYNMVRMNSATAGLLTTVNSTNDLIGWKVSVSGTTISLSASQLTIDSGDAVHEPPVAVVLSSTKLLLLWVENVTSTLKIAIISVSGATPVNTSGTTNITTGYDGFFDLVVDLTNNIFLVCYSNKFWAGSLNAGLTTITMAAAAVTLTNMGTHIAGGAAGSITQEQHNFHLVGDTLIDIYKDGSNNIVIGKAVLNPSTNPDSITVLKTTVATATGVALGSGGLQSQSRPGSFRIGVAYQNNAGSFEAKAFVIDYIVNVLGLVVAGVAAGQTAQIRELGKQAYASAKPSASYFAENGALVFGSEWGDKARVGRGSYQYIFVGK